MSEEGASYKEQLLEGCRRNNTDLIHEIFTNLGQDHIKIAQLINESRDPLGNTALHLAAHYGNYDALDIILDQEGVDLDPVNNIDGDTPLHLAVRYTKEEPEHGAFVVEELIEAGADARIKNKSGLKPVELIHGENDKLVEALQGAEYAVTLEEEEANRSEYLFRQDVEHGLTLQDEIEEEEGEEGSASGSESD